MGPAVKATVEVGMRKVTGKTGMVVQFMMRRQGMSERAGMTERRRQSIPRKARTRMIGMKRQLARGMMEVGGRPS